uniref:DUF4806 domain-containing protein n=1 Tax=Parastrongyloides trichosuri TaxID=131310 RepID=A0A0N4ZDG3_PARTI
MQSPRSNYALISYRRSKSNSSGVSSELSSCFFTDDDTNFNPFNQAKLSDSTTYSEFEGRISSKVKYSDDESEPEVQKKYYEIESVPVPIARKNRYISPPVKGIAYKNIKIESYNESNIYENIIPSKPVLPPKPIKYVTKNSNLDLIPHTKMYGVIDRKVSDNIDTKYKTKIGDCARSTPDECYGSDSSSDFNDDETEFMNITNRIIENMEKDETPAPYLSDIRDKEPFIYSMMVIRILNNARNAHSKKVFKCQQQIEDLLNIPHLFDLNCFNDDKTWSANTKIFGNQIVDHLGLIRRVSQKDYDNKTRKLYKILRDVKEKSFVRTAVDKITAQIRKLF